MTNLPLVVGISGASGVIYGIRLLEILLGRLEQVVSKDEIAKGLFGFDDEAGPNAIELYIGRLRRKLGEHGPLRITTVRGVGYKAEAAAP